MNTLSLRQTLPHAGILLAACLWLAGCAGPGGLFGAQEAPPPFRDPAMTMESAQGAIVAGQSTKADVAAALGAAPVATVVKFDSGWEVWVYRKKAPQPAVTNPELVILFTPDGIVKKTRIRPAYPAGEERRD
ncbi:hypothetical protein [Polaromonas aquatica]|uniref:hypothetical protein n=1 Tax=Polaromonas aquatica TaxID=332657 RepID=UPI003D65E396